MDTVHNPDRFMGDLRQILSQGRKRIGVLIGAGAPLSVRVDAAGNLDPAGEALIPGVDALTDMAIAKLAGEQATAAAAIRAELPKGGNIESILSQVRLLQTALGTTPKNGLDGPGYGELGKVICQAIGELVGANLPSGRTPYHELVSWISGTQRAHAVEVFTTNYDLLVRVRDKVSRLTRGTKLIVLTRFGHNAGATTRHDVPQSFPASERCFAVPFVRELVGTDWGFLPLRAAEPSRNPA